MPQMPAVYQRPYLQHSGVAYSVKAPMNIALGHSCWKMNQRDWSAYDMQVETRRYCLLVYCFASTEDTCHHRIHRHVVVPSSALETGMSKRRREIVHGRRKSAVVGDSGSRDTERCPSTAEAQLRCIEAALMSVLVTGKLMC